ncbi:MAG TPA: tRNA (N6-isopentenyl adenosine(37)-C2)-methylthiotransferase MiaB [Tepidisphaeraceae bacterium]|jgi:tRNA-2-methylthio-N6-dimethylallyladenosine synthase|nr:tRNA (N6-isopentenyl adenosine(37)-C2)-methylthiotransferase MiaB [Tepidisphaeraceae bacterium]
MRRKLYLETFGCQMNVLDSELVLGQLRSHGYESIEDRDGADVILYNTCSVREHAEQKVWSRLGELRDRKKADPSLIIGVIGCMAERDGKTIFQRHPHIDILCGPGELDKLASLVHNAVVTGQAGKRERQIALMGAAVRRSGTLDAAEDTLELLDLSRSVSAHDNVAQAYVRITRGCNKFCTYCVVPYTRGPEVHRPPQNIVDEVRRLADAGVREVTLLGQTINHYLYGHGDGRKTTFAELLYEIHEAVPHLPRLRFVTSFPRDFTDDALRVMRDCERICRYLHVPAQSGSDRILKLMNRGYTASQYLDLIDRAKAVMPDICIASDFIVGFPTETEEDFEKTAGLVRRCGFKNSFIFKYSPRPGTTAIDRFLDDVPEDIKKRRNNELLAVQQEVCAENNRRMVGKTVQVMVEGRSKLASKPSYPSAPHGVELGWEKRRTEREAAIAPDDVQLIGRTGGDQIVAFDGDLSLKGQLIDVEIVDARNMTLFGKTAAVAV